MNPNRANWNEKQKELRHALLHASDQAVPLFLEQHAAVHSAQMSGQAGIWSFEDEVWQDLPESAARRIPTGGEHSIAWIFWHLTRIEDMTMNGLLAGRSQVYQGDNWPERLGISVRDTGNAMNEASIRSLSDCLAIGTLREYRLAVGRATREAVQMLQTGDFKRPVEPARLRQLLDAGDVVEDAYGLLDYWGSLTLAELLLMPPTRHIFIHLNEALRLKQKCLRAARK